MTMRFTHARSYRAPWFAVTCVSALAMAAFTSTASAINVGSINTPDVTVNVTPINLNGWSQQGFLDWAPGDPTIRGASASFVDNVAAPGTANGAWQHTAVYPAIPDYSVNGYFELAFGGLAGRLVSDWQGFGYRNFQAAAGSNHAVVLFELDQDGDLDTPDTVFIRFQPLLYAQSDAGAVPANVWNEYGVDDQSTKFLDAINAGTASQKKFQSIEELFLVDALKAGSGTGGTVIPQSTVFKNVIIAGGLQGFPSIEEQIDYIQFSFSDGTTRYDFGAESGQTTDPNAVPEPATAGLAMIGLGALIMRRRRA